MKDKIEEIIIRLKGQQIKIEEIRNEMDKIEELLYELRKEEK